MMAGYYKQSTACLVISCVIVVAHASNSVRELARGAILKSWPYGDQQVMRRMVMEYEEFANSVDYDDCGKKLLCILAGKRQSELEWDEEMLVKMYTRRIDYSSPTVQFSVATQVGAASPDNCDNVYSNCLLSIKELLSSLRDQGISVDIPGTDRDCSFYMLWRHKKVTTPEPTAATTVTNPTDNTNFNILNNLSAAVLDNPTVAELRNEVDDSPTVPTSAVLPISADNDGFN